jgi:spore maturation protein CgeB
MSKRKVLYIGFEYQNGDVDKGKSLDIDFFVNSINSIDGYFASGLYIDNYQGDDREIYILNNVKRKSPDLILTNISKDEISDGVLRSLNKNYMTVNWFGDDQWRFDNFSKHKAKLFDYVITTDKSSVNKYKKIGIKNVIYSQWAAVKLEQELNINEYKYDISFVGSYSPTRDWIISKLKLKNINVKVFGMGWEQSSKVDYYEMTNIFKYSKINLNLSNSTPKDINFLFYYLYKFFTSFKKLIQLKFNVFLKESTRYLKNIRFFFFYEKTKEQIKARNFEIPAAGGFQISSFAPEITDYFSASNEIVLYETLNDLIEKTNFYLNNNQEREKIKKAGYTKAINNTYQIRFEKVLSIIFNN